MILRLGSMGKGGYVVKLGTALDVGTRRGVFLL